MAETDPVKIVVEVVSNIEDDVAEIQAELESLRKDILADFEIDDHGDIEELRMKMQALLSKFEATVDVDTEDVNQAEIQLDTLARDRVARIRAVADRDDLLSERQQMFSRFIGGIGGEGEGIFGFDPQDRFGSPASLTRRQMMGGLPHPESVVPDVGTPRRFDPDVDFNERLREVRGGFRNLGQTLLEYKPSIMDWWNILALLIPIMITLAGAVIGLAGAFIALGGAAATLLGVGLLGWGDSLQETFQNLKKDVMELARAVHGVVQPAAVAFRPVVEDFLDAIPPAVEALVGPMKEALLFVDTLAAAGSGFIDWLSDAIRAAGELQQAIHNVVMAVGSGFGEFLIELFSSMVREVNRNFKAYAQLAEIFVEFFVILFNLSKVVTFAVAQFGFLFDVAVKLSEILSNKWVAALLAGTTATLMMGAALTQVVTLLQVLAGTTLTRVALGLGIYISKVVVAIAKTWEWIASLQVLNSSLLGTIAGLTLVTGGAALALGAGAMVAGSAFNAMGGGPAGAGQSQQSIGGNTFIRVEGDVEKKQMDKLIDKMPGEARREHNTLNSMEGR